MTTQGGNAAKGREQEVVPSGRCAPSAAHAPAVAWRHHLTMVYIATKNWLALDRLWRVGL